ncbi:MAG: hypothetical protein PVJ19_06225 [Desulfobacteraceae bacterium]|jgi:hypothetical protein
MRFIKTVIISSLFFWLLISTPIYAADTDFYPDADAGDSTPAGPICLFEQINLEDAEDIYGQMCASCHGYSVEDKVENKVEDKKEGADFPLDGDVCSFDTVQAMVDCYWTIDLHDEVKGCDDACVCATSTYIYEVFLEGKGDDSKPGASAADETSADSDGDGSSGCFVQILLTRQFK